MTEWLSSRGSQKRSGSEAFAGDWESYENRHGTRNNNGTILPHLLHRRPPANNSNFNVHKSNSTSKVVSPYAQPCRHDRSPNLPPTNVDVASFGPSMRNPKPTATLPDDVPLNEEQRLVVESVLSGYSTFFTGPAGSGKSHVLSSILRWNEEGDPTPKKRIVVTATTGVAACNVGGVTIHSFAGVGTGEGPLSNMVSKVMGNAYAKKRWNECDVLVIDEISMMPAKFLDDLDFVASRARNDRRPFGGIQVVLCGDFFQLPPVSLQKGGFAFEAECWSKILQCSISLKQIFRQNGDTRFMDILNEARIGELSHNSAQILRNHSLSGQLPNVKEDEDNDAVKPTLLECRNQQVDRANHLEMSKLPGDEHTFVARDRAVSKAHEAQLKHCQAPEKLTLKVGAQVILLKNLDQENGLVNGSRGVIVDFQMHPNSRELPKEFKRMELPVVRFDAIESVGNESASEKDDSKEKTVKIIEPAEWVNKVGDNIVSSRIQIPLRPAWALSVHKSQGMTIPNLTVSLGGVFEYGQAYVALSRATTLNRLTLRGFNERAFRAHPKVKEFYRMIEEKIPLASKRLSSNTTMTAEQMKRMEENRLRALEIRRKKQAAAAASAASKGSPDSVQDPLPSTTSPKTLYDFVAHR